MKRDARPRQQHHIAKTLKEFVHSTTSCQHSDSKKQTVGSAKRAEQTPHTDNYHRVTRDHVSSVTWQPSATCGRAGILPENHRCPKTMHRTCSKGTCQHTRCNVPTKCTNYYTNLRVFAIAPIRNKRHRTVQQLLHNARTQNKHMHLHDVQPATSKPAARARSSLSSSTNFASDRSSFGLGRDGIAFFSSSSLLFALRMLM